MTVRNVHRQNAVRPQMAKVELKSLDGKQVNRNRIAGESVYHEQIKLLRREVFQRQARVSQFERDARLGIPQEAEVLLCDLHDQRIDLVERVFVAGAAIRRNGAGAQAN